MKTLVMALVLLALCGCAMPEQDDDVMLELAVRAGTSRILAEHPSWAQPAARIARTAREYIAAEETATLQQLEAFVTDKIPWEKLTPEERALLQTFLPRLESRIISRLQSQGVERPEELLVRLSAVLLWIEQTASG